MDDKKGRTIAYGLWHLARIEDITMNILVADEIIKKLTFTDLKRKMWQEFY